MRKKKEKEYIEHNFIGEIKKLPYKLIKRYVSFCEENGKKPFSADMEKRLSLISPGVSMNSLVADYYADKLKTVLLISGGLIFITALLVYDRSNSSAITENRIVRNTYKKGAESITVRAYSDNYDYGSIDLKVNEQKYTEEEAEEKMDEIYGYFKPIILGENKSFDCIDKDMNLPAEAEGYEEFEIRWESGDYLLLRNNGELGDTEEYAQGADVDLNLTVIYGEYEKTYSYPLRLYPPAMEEADLRLKELMDEIESRDKATENLDYQELPGSVNNERITWEESSPPIIPVALVLLPLLLLVVWKAGDRDLGKKYEERNKELSMDYSELVSKIQLLISSGMTIRGSIERIVKDYKEEAGAFGRKKYVYEELSLCVRKIQDGMDEGQAYELFGRRCSLMTYKKLSALLTQNLKKGTDGLIEALSTEVKAAFEDRKMFARKMGEEAQTKLIFPMILMLGVVIMIIMVPAYMSFGA